MDLLDIPIRFQDSTRHDIIDSQSIDYARWVACLGVCGLKQSATDTYLARWPKSIGAVSINQEVDLGFKAAVLPGTTGGADWAAPLVGVASLAEGFIKIARSRSLFGQIPGLHMIPFNTKVPLEAGAAVYNWVGESKPKPLSVMSFNNGITLPMLKALGLIVLSKELLKLTVPGTEQTLRDTLVAGLVSFQDLAFLSPAITAVAGVRPASITNGLTATVNTGNLQADVTTMLGVFFTARPGGDPVLIAGGQKAAQLRALQPGFGFPIYKSEAAGGTVVALDPAGVFYADGGVETAVSDATTLQMESAPADPVLATTVMFSLFQNNAVCYRTERFLNYAAVPGAVQYVAA